MTNTTNEFGTLLADSIHGDRDARAQLDVRLYAELRRVAAAAMRGERAEHTLQPTALANEAYMRLMKDREVTTNERSHFLAASAVVMRRILVDHARAKKAQKRGGERHREILPMEVEDQTLDVEKLHDALEQLAAQHKRAAAVVEQKFFGGMTHEEIGTQLGVSSRTVQEDWKFARAWLNRAMHQA